MSNRAPMAIGAGLLLAVAGCTTQPSTTETTPPTLTLNIGDTQNSANNVQNAPQAVIPKNPKKTTVDDGVNMDPSLAPYVYNLAVIAKDPGGIANFGYSVSFLDFGGCNPSANYGQGTSYTWPPTAVPLNGDGSAQSEQIGLVVATSANERKAECNGTPGNAIAGAYIVTATATNFSKLTASATWFVNIGSQHTIPVQLK